jgi:hypothetical protein
MSLPYDPNYSPGAWPSSVQAKSDISEVQDPAGTTSTDLKSKSAKRARSCINSDTGSKDAEGQADHPFLYLPLEVLAEILLYTISPKDLLAVARTCKALCAQLVSPGSAFIWRKMREKVKLPDPAAFRPVVTVSNFQPILQPDSGAASYSRGVELFVGREPAYAAFVFDGGLCEVRLTINLARTNH